MQHILFSTRKSENHYKFIINSILLRLKKENINIYKITYPRKKKLFSLNFFIFFVKSFFYLNFFSKEKILNLNYRNCNIGRHIISMSYREFNSYFNIFIFFKNFLKNLYFSICITDQAYEISKEISVAYIDHCGYLNGIYFRVFALKKKIIFSNNFPRGIYFTDFRKKINTCFNQPEKPLQFYRDNKINYISYKKNKQHVKKIVSNPNLVIWMKKTKYSNNKKNFIDLKSFDRVVYAQSFIDAQLWYGNDGFFNVKDWLEFTLEKLSILPGKTIVKAHPNFFNKFADKYVEYDKKIFNKIIKKYQSEKIFFINRSVNNKYLLNNLKKNTIIISHHGTVLLEALYFGFKCISSAATFWSPDLKLTNQWSSREGYNNILKKNVNELFFPNKTDLACVSSQLYLSPITEWGKKNMFETILRNIGYAYRSKLLKPKLNLNIKPHLLNKIYREIAGNILNISK